MAPPKQKEDSDSEDDPLDAFMADLEKSAKQSGLNPEKGQKAAAAAAAEQPKQSKKASQKAVRADIDGEDDEESYYR